MSKIEFKPLVLSGPDFKKTANTKPKYSQEVSRILRETELTYTPPSLHYDNYEKVAFNTSLDGDPMSFVSSYISSEYESNEGQKIAHPDDMEKNAYIIGGTHHGESHFYDSRIERYGLNLMPKGVARDSDDWEPECYKVILLNDANLKKVFPVLIHNHMIQSGIIADIISKHGFSF